jgi:glycosyltransferase involved in cell wall biosynthesis
MQAPILHIIKATGLAGAERHLIILLSGLRREGVDARLLVLTNPGDPVTAFFDAARERDIPASAMSIGGSIDVPLLFRLKRYLQLLAPALVHTHLIHADLYGTLAARMAGVPLVITTRHNDDRFRYETPYRQLNRFLWSRVDCGIAVSNSISRFSVAVEDAPANRIHTVHHGVELPGTAEGDRFGVSGIDRAARRQQVRQTLGIDEKKAVGIFCRLTQQKGISFGLRAFALLLRELSDVTLLVAGEGPMQDELARYAGQLGIGNQVKWLGWRSDIPNLLAAVDLLLAPSLFEGFGLIFLDAMANELPIVSSTASAIPEVVVSGETGFLVAPRDVEGMATAMFSLLSNPRLCEEMGKAGRERLGLYFGAERMIAKTLAIYRQLQNP